MHSSRRFSSTGNQVQAEGSNPTSPSDVTSVWVGTRRASLKDPRTAPTKKVPHHCEEEAVSGQQKSVRRGGGGTGRGGGGGGGEYVVVSVKNSTHTDSGSRRNSTVIHPMSTTTTTTSARRSSASSDHSGPPRPSSSVPSSSSSSSFSSSPWDHLPLQSGPAVHSRVQGGTGSGHRQANPESGSAVHSRVQGGTGSGHRQANLESGPAVHSRVQGGTGSGQANLGKGVGISGHIATDPSIESHILSSSSSTPSENSPQYGSGSGSCSGGDLLPNTGRGLNVGSLSSNGPALFGGMNSLYGAAGFMPPLASPSMPVLPLLTSSDMGSLPFPAAQQLQLSPDLLASSLDLTLVLSRAASLLGLTPLQTTPPLTSSLLGLTQSPLLPTTLATGQLPTLPQASSLLGLTQTPILPIPSAGPLNLLSGSLAMNQALQSPDLQFPALSKLLTTPTLPMTSPPAEVVSPQKKSAAPAVSQKQVHRKSPPPLLSQNPSEAYHAKRASAKTRRTSKQPPPSAPPLPLTPSTVDPEDDHMTSRARSSDPPSTRPCRSSPIPQADSVCDVWSGSDQVHSPVVSVQPCYLPPPDPQCCMRCGKKVYTMEKQVGPVRRVLYHKTCFTCAACRSALTLSNYHLNDDDKEDLNVYCVSHKPLFKHSPLDAEALLLQQTVLAVPRQEMWA
ncbi:uncharacterized protein LOC143299415 [Babylonia areolata]|uniref:uncharacterized protein LOC143299415 n=1 Tax=Babylonia areolata TaxID=304850 RepID=UPI003FD26A6C